MLIIKECILSNIQIVEEERKYQYRLNIIMDVNLKVTIYLIIAFVDGIQNTLSCQLNMQNIRLLKRRKAVKFEKYATRRPCSEYVYSKLWNWILIKYVIFNDNISEDISQRQIKAAQVTAWVTVNSMEIRASLLQSQEKNVCVFVCFQNHKESSTIFCSFCHFCVDFFQSVLL